jgi:hypothetical protein
MAPLHLITYVAVALLLVALGYVLFQRASQSNMAKRAQKELNGVWSKTGGMREQYGMHRTEARAVVARWRAKGLHRVIQEHDVVPYQVLRRA